MHTVSICCVLRLNDFTHICESYLAELPDGQIDLVNQVNQVGTENIAATKHVIIKERSWSNILHQFKHWFSIHKETSKSQWHHIMVLNCPSRWHESQEMSEQLLILFWSHTVIWWNGTSQTMAYWRNKGMEGKTLTEPNDMVYITAMTTKFRQQRLNFEHTKDTPNPTLRGKLWGVYCEYFGWN